MLKFIFWLLWKHFRSAKRNFQFTSILAVLAMTLGVASLVISMAVVSSYTSALKSTVVETFGDILVLNSKAKLSNQKEIISQIESLGEEVQSYTPFVSFEAIIAQKGIVSGVLLQGFEPDSLGEVLNFSSRIVKGKLELQPVNGVPSVVIGSRLAKKLKLGVGDSLNVVIASQRNRESFAMNPKLQKFTIQGIISYGRFDYDTRYIMTDIFTAQKFALMGEKINGFRMKLKDNTKADMLSAKINQIQAGSSFWSVSWKKINSNLFAAAEYEKIIIFFTLLIIIIAACFNIASTLFVHVFSRFKDMSVLKALGVSKKKIKNLFVLQGLVLGALGYFFGAFLGVFLYWSFVQAQNKWHLLDAEVYKLDKLVFELQFIDLFVVFVASMLICYFSTLIPAKRAGELFPTEGLRYE